MHTSARVRMHALTTTRGPGWYRRSAVVNGAELHLRAPARSMDEPIETG